MKDLAGNLLFVVSLAKVQAAISRRLDMRLSAYGLGFTDFVILYHLSKARGEKMRRVDLASAIEITASGVTRLLAPMEKYGLVSRDVNERDARVSYVVLTAGGKRLLKEAVSSAEHVAEAIFPLSKIEEITQLNKLFENLIDSTL
jgi:DNA-binding MarR family transcriptional regulator